MTATAFFNHDAPLQWVAEEGDPDLSIEPHAEEGDDDGEEG